MDWRERMIEFIREERSRLTEQIDVVSSGRCQLWQMTAGGEREDVTAEHLAKLRGYVAEIQQIMIEEGLS